MAQPIWLKLDEIAAPFEATGHAPSATKAHVSGLGRSYKISTCFDALVHCSECQASRPMEIKTIKPGGRGGGDEIIYQCTQCGAETSKFAE